MICKKAWNRQASLRIWQQRQRGSCLPDFASPFGASRVAVQHNNDVLAPFFSPRSPKRRA